jgi:Uma2 family endonuclease
LITAIALYKEGIYAKWNSLTKQQKRKFVPLDPDFVLELMSPTDDIDQLQNKMNMGDRAFFSRP